MTTSERNSFDGKILTENLKKERYSVAYISAVAAACGFLFQLQDIDMNGVDGKIITNGKRRPELKTNAELSVQLKSQRLKTERSIYELRNTTEPVNYKLCNSNFWHLCRMDHFVPCILNANQGLGYRPLK